ncbi:helix-turn-helix domain-containing protein [Sediminibacterium soli]|uniref:helix-turn-helix domain-containing protein n=1 Tax=Sediminibacterium soli TaxID=2698829 RepID=UPI00137A1B0D|nr:helix-turn-helix transcriptional regulator [Sediminibacterium soli]NCI47185.1 helix-turn-helix transcriptional regulator [Sediminibacterium soli]
MQNFIRFDTIKAYNQWNRNETRHPLVNLVDLSMAAPRQHNKMRFDFYTVFLKEVKCGDLRYGCNYYDYEEGTLVFVGPGQVIGVENDGSYFQPKGKVLVFHPDFIRGSALGRHIGDYRFFSYEMHEALHLSDTEKQVILDCFDKIDFELRHPIDKHSQKLIISNIELFLNYCTRFYDRQFITRENVHRGVLERFENLLHDYYTSGQAPSNGLPSVAWCAQQLNLSANYFGDLIKKETGRSAQEQIQEKLIDIAKERMFDASKSVSEIAYELGFKYPQHFTRLFKQRVGMPPNEYRSMHN